jgi:hypothetical protein
MIALLVVLVVVSSVQVVAWAGRGHWAVAVIGAVFIVSYPIDLMAIHFTGEAFLAYSVPRASFGAVVLQAAGIYIILAWLLFTFAVLPDKRPEKADESAIWQAPRSMLFVVVTFALAMIGFRSVFEYGISETLTSRQVVFGGSALALIVYFAMPALAVIGAYGALATSSLRRIGFSMGALIALGTVALSGSRTSLAIAVLAILSLMWRYARLLRLPGRHLLRAAIGVVSVAVPVVLAGWYLRNVRGVVTPSQGSVLTGPDVSQADVLVSLMLSGDSSRGSYLAGPFWFIPRELWEGKPLPGNAETSLSLTPSRYLLTGSETTAGVLGEAFLNGGWWGIITASAILAIAALAIQRLLNSSDMALWCLGVVLLLRSVNLVRGDLTNFVAPASVAIVIWLILFPRRRRRYFQAKPVSR